MYAKVKEIYSAVLDVSPDEREAYLCRTCGDDAELRNELNSLLAFEGTFDSIIDTPPDSLAAEIISSADEPDFTGADIGHYKITSQIGRGGMSTVYLAEDKLLRRNVAVKFLNKEFTEFPGRPDRFLSEAKSASSLNHPNIITVHEVGENEGTYFLVTEYIAGETLRKRLGDGELAVDSALNIAIQIASALDAAHSAGIIHRDVKPDNIMIRPDGLVKILDFGIAKMAEFTGNSDKQRERFDTTPGTIIGTTDYMSPEQVRGEAVTAQADIFSFGIVLFEMLSGKLPFAGATRSDVMASILTQDPNMSDLDDVPIELNDIVERSLRKEKEGRYQSSRELNEDLLRFQKAYELNHAIERSLALDVRARIGGKYIASYFKSNDQTVMGVVFSLVLIAGLAVGYGYLTAERNGPSRSIAVMPFVNKSSNANNEYLCDGLTESLINSLSQSRGLSVKARTSVFAYKDKDPDPQKIGGELAVQTIVTGSISQQEDRVILSLELVDTMTGNQIWGSRYQRDASDIAGLQNDVVRDLITRLGLEFTGTEERKAKTHTENSDAYRRYLKGRYFWNKRTGESFNKAIEEFRAAVDLDPNYALAYVGLSDSFILLENFAGTSSSESIPLAKAYAERALEIDDQLPQAHASRALTLHRSWNWAEAEKAYKRAIELNPNYASVQHFYSLFLRETGRTEASLAPAKLAHELDPLSGIITGNLGVTFLALGDTASAVKLMERAVVADTSFAYGYSILGLAYIKQGRYTEAVTETQKGVDLSKRAGNALAVDGYAKAIAGRRSEALNIISELKLRFDRRTAIGQNVASVYAGLGENDQAFAWLEKDLQAHSSFLPYICWLPAFESLHDDPRYNELLTRMGMLGN